MSDRVVVHLPTMPQPKDFGLDGKTESKPAAQRYEKALAVWERVVRDISKLYGGFFALEAAPGGGLLARLTLPAITGSSTSR